MVVSLRKAFAFAFALLAFAPARAAAQGGTITDRVTNAENGEPIPEATVFALASTGAGVGPRYSGERDVLCTSRSYV